MFGSDCRRYDLTSTFDVLVGKAPSSSQRFTVYTDVLTSRSNFFKAARKLEWRRDFKQPVDLKDENPGVFSKYLNCVYFGIQALEPDGEAPEDDRDYPESPCIYTSSPAPDAFNTCLRDHEAQWQKETYEPGNYGKYLAQHFQVQVEVYLLADRLQDIETANIVIDEIVRFADSESENPEPAIISSIYEATVHGNPLRKWARDTQAYDTSSHRHMLLHVGDYPADFKRDVAVELMRIRDCEEYVSKLLWAGGSESPARVLLDKCRYHLHDKHHPRCVPEPEEWRGPPSE